MCGLNSTPEVCERDGQDKRNSKPIEEELRLRSQSFILGEAMLYTRPSSVMGLITMASLLFPYYVSPTDAL